MQFSRSYLQLGEAFYQTSEPKHFPSPELLLFDKALAQELGFTKEQIDNTEDLQLLLCGQKYFNDETPVALAYSGHQFGQFNPSLGDGRAHYLTEITSPDNQSVELQLKGSGPTPFSRGGDGLCALGPAVREYIMSAAMSGLGVPTTRSFSVVKTGEKVFRNGVSDGAVVSRLAQSHVRVGTFQYFAYRGNVDALRKLADYCLEKYFAADAQNQNMPYVDMTDAEKYGQLLESVIERQIRLIVEWMRVGFIHGVMNTDNTSIVGDTIDFGPCAMLGAYDPNTTFSSIDQQKRYAFGNQSNIGLWNLTRFAECLIPLIHREEPEKAVEILESKLRRYSELFSQNYKKMMCGKLGIAEKHESADELIEDWLNLLKTHQLDYTNSFSGLIDILKFENQANTFFPKDMSDFLNRWQKAVCESDAATTDIITSMERHNPYIIPRNHLVEKAIADCVDHSDLSTTHELMEAMKAPYERSEGKQKFTSPPEDGDRNYVTFCGT